MRENKEVEPVICKDFMCNKVLCSQEILSGEYCISEEVVSCLKYRVPPFCDIVKAAIIPIVNKI